MISNGAQAQKSSICDEVGSEQREGPGRKRIRIYRLTLELEKGRTIDRYPNTQDSTLKARAQKTTKINAETKPKICTCTRCSLILLFLLVLLLHHAH